MSAAPGLETASDLVALFRDVDARPTPAAYAQAARRLDELDGDLRPLRIALLASFTVEPETPFLRVEAARRGFAARIYLAPFNSVRQELLDPESGCARYRPDVVFISALLVDVSPPLVEDFLSLTPMEVARLAETVVSETIGAVAAFRKRSPAPIVVHNFSLPPRPLLGSFEVMARDSQTEAIRRLNADLVTAARELPDVYVLDYDRLCAEVGYANCHDPKLWYLGRAALSARLLPRLARAQAAVANALFGTRRKCLVVDLDDTLWGGIVGEVGAAGVQLGDSFPGNIYRDFQRALLALYRSGTLLAINSKNNAEDVEEVFRTRREMVLTWDHFASKRINWRPKPENMREIAAELNLGIESLVFFDDNPAEQDLMRLAEPGVLTLSVPPDPLRFLDTLAESRAFDRLALTEEDRRRGEIYTQQASRRSFEGAAATLEEFLHGLEMVVSIEPVSPATLPRVVELLQKTNQFNLTTRRHSAARVVEMASDPDFSVFSLRLTDRFGDNGIVGVAILHSGETAALIESFLLSCRVIGRGVETALLMFLVERARSRGLAALEGDFLATAKNAPAADFYARHGFHPVEREGNGHRWRLDLSQVPFAWPESIRRAVSEP